MKNPAVLLALLTLAACADEPDPTARRMTPDEARSLDQAAEMIGTRQSPPGPADPAESPAP